MRLGFSTWNKPISQHVSPLAGKTTNRRAVCREIRMSGSEGGGIEANRCFLSLLLLAEHGFEMVRYADDFGVMCRWRKQPRHWFW
jgi:hypothetical protein